MNKHLEEFVYNNREDFDVYEPSLDVWNKIQKNSKTNKVKPLKWIKYAAAIAIFISGFAIGSFKSKTDIVNNLSVINKQQFNEQSQLIESEYYYMSEINNRMVELKPFFASDPHLERDIKIDFDELDTFYNQLKNDLEDDINNTQVIEAMIHSYQIKLEILNALLKQLKQYDNEDIKHDI